jgi:hypothetical protein
MPYFVVSDFRGGLSATRLITTAAPGTLRTLNNAHINRGGEIEKRLALETYATLPAGTLGLAGLAGALYAFGTPPSPTMPAGVSYQRLVPSDGASVTKILDVKGFDGKLYVSALCDNGRVRHFYDGTQVTVFTGQTDAENGRILLTLGANMYAASGSTLHRCATDTPTDWNTASIGAGFFNMSTQAAGSEVLTGLAEYDSDMAVFSRRTVQIWTFSADPAASSPGNRLRNTGCVSPRTVLPFAGSDVFFLGDSGVRSLRSRDLTDSPSAADVGTPIDDIISERVRTMTADELVDAHAVIEPTGGRYWLVLGSDVYVFSYFPASKISAWSTYALPGAATATVAVDGVVYTRVGDTIYRLGGAYDATVAEVELPYLDGRAIATWKRWKGIDIAAEGAWDVYASYDPSVPDEEDLVARLIGSTFHQLNTPMLGSSPYVKLRFVSTGTGAAKLGSVAAHYERDGAA